MDHQLEVGSENRPEQRSQMLEGNEKNLKQQAKSDYESETVVSEHRPEQRSQGHNGDENNLQQKTKLDSQCDSVVSEHRHEQRSQGQEGDEDNLQRQAKLDNQSITDAMDSAQLQKEGTECTLRHLQSPICRQDEQLNEEEEENHVENRLRPEQSSDVLEDNEPNLQQQAKLDNQSHTDEENQVVSEHRPEQRSPGQDGDANNLQQKTKLDSQCDSDAMDSAQQKKEGAQCTLRHLQSPTWRQDRQLHEEEEKNQVENNEPCKGMSASNVQSPRSIQDAQLHQDGEKNRVENVVSEYRPEQKSQGQDANENNLQQKAKLDNQSDTGLRPEQSSEAQEVNVSNLQQQAKLDNQSHTDEENQGETCEGILLSNVQFPVCRQDGKLHHDEAKTHVENGKWSVCLAAVLLVPVACIMLNFLNQQESEVVENKLNIFLQNFDKVQKSFPNQDEQLWKKSRIMLQKHINMTVHSEPSILMFAAAWNANETMHCLTDRIAEAYASAFNSRFLKIEGSSKKFLNSDKVKLDLDNQLTSWFGAGSKSAVIHHFQDLPPPSTLLFYKYCDHENAAFKDVALLITVLVDEEKLDPNLSFNLLEERVYDFLVTKFSISSQTGQYNTLDIDKFSGLWSRIAHAILPVQPEKDIEKNGCKHK
ncbi:torsin-1A-interacting protein 1-like isoform X2 [Chiloscyllium plagiosum]|uniref:torsin-1A-interacting protein 1-like isoform X2 n=1 Tax=Chiloscyllium plagiosum TaxID=36176 RepID=UPI001CB8702A|nr:torsin-1A-interacting protein 1-like isoform X2 [Chiloscyllium plagiosum]